MPTTPLFQVGERVLTNDGTYAIIIEVIEDTQNAESYIYHIGYDNGSDGYWPENTLTAVSTV
jgi:hypothetical protein